MFLDLGYRTNYGGKGYLIKRCFYFLLLFVLYPGLDLVTKMRYAILCLVQTQPSGKGDSVLSTIQKIHVDGHTLASRALNLEASGSPHIILHGITASIYFWTPDLLRPFLKRGPCYALSLPGHYPATFPPHFHTEDLTAKMIAQVLTKAIHHLVGDQPITLVGHSTGGFAAVNIAARTPKLAKRVVSIAGFARGQWSGLLGLNQHWVRKGLLGKTAFKTTYKLAGVHRSFFEWSLKFYTADAHSLYTYPNFKKIVDINYSKFKNLDLNAMVHYFCRMPDIDISSILSHITAPTLAIAGDRDPIVPPAQSRLIAAKIPDADLAVISDSGHTPFLERPDAYQNALESWLSKTEPM